MEMNVKVKVLDKKALHFGLPRYQTAGSAGMDLHACIDAPVKLQPGLRFILRIPGL